MAIDIALYFLNIVSIKEASKMNVVPQAGNASCTQSYILKFQH